jgi:spermidine synthase
MFGNNTSIDDGVFFKPANRTWAIFWVSVVGLFLEMLLIRWIGTEVRIFAYLQNTILIACFLGLGLGCFTCRKPINLQQGLLPLLVLLIMMAIPASRATLSYTSDLLTIFGNFVIWGGRDFTNSAILTRLFLALLGLIITFILVLLVVNIFVPFGRLLGRLMDEHPNTIWAYSANIAGSLVGTWLFVLLSLFSLPPFAWLVVLVGLLLIFLVWVPNHRKSTLLLLAAMVVIGWFAGQTSDAMKVVWSPYQKLVLQQPSALSEWFGKYYMIMVNNTGYQAMLNLEGANISANPEIYPEEMNGLSQYDIPLLLHPDPKSFLIVGAGSGNDAAGGLRQGVKEITAVEIDPAIISLGKEYHPEQPYASSNVKVVNDDARSFFATTNQKYDVISFSLLDSHTTTAMTNARLDHYVYTKESISKAKTLLAPGGIMVLTFEAQKSYITDRMERVLQEVFGQEPIYFRIPSTPYGWGGVMFITGDLTAARQQIAGNTRLNALITQWQKDYPITLTNSTRITTDDWPYIYLESPSIPPLFFMLAAILLLVLFASGRTWQANDLVTRWSGSHWHFFFLGAAFLLLEVQNVSKASVVLGNTWQVNAVIVSGVLAMALIANWLAKQFPRIPLVVLYIGLIGISLALYFVDLAQFAFLPYASKALVVGGLTALPMLFSGMVFVRSFAAIERKDEALGANLVGSLVGALLQSITFISGIKMLLLIVAGLYFLSLLTLPGLFKMRKAANAVK